MSIKSYLRRILTTPLLRLGDRFGSKPNQERVFSSLSALLKKITTEGKRGRVIPFDLKKGRFIIFSDQHKGCKDGADDFTLCEPNYLAALDYYHNLNFHYIALGDCEELWENSWTSVKKAQMITFQKESLFLPNDAFIKIFGNHDLFWDNDPFAAAQLKEVYGQEVKIHEGVVLQTTIGAREINIFCTHGHQGDLVSDGNWFSKFFVSRIWAPLQSYLQINPNTPAYDARLKTKHNEMMYDWSASQDDLILITGHTHQPVFESLTHLERIYRLLLIARKSNDEERIKELEKEIVQRKFQYNNINEEYLALKPRYFNSGCCCYNDGDITGIEIDAGCIRLVKWHVQNGAPERLLLEEASLEELFA